MKATISIFIFIAIITMTIIATPSTSRYANVKTQRQLDSIGYLDIDMVNYTYANINGKVALYDFATKQPSGTFGISIYDFYYIGEGTIYSFDRVLCRDTSKYYFFIKKYKKQWTSKN